MSSVRQLQRAAGNQALGRVLRSVRIGGGAATHLQRESDVAARQTIRIGARGPQVTELQMLLNTAGANPSLAADGVFGPRTHAEVVRYQLTRGLTPDGIVGPRTWAALDGGAPPMAPAPAASSETIINADEGGGTVPADFTQGQEGPGTVAHTSTVVNPQDCLEQREACHRCCEDLHPWWRPWEFRERQRCKEECCNWAFVQCMLDGTFPCLCKS